MWELLRCACAVCIAQLTSTIVYAAQILCKVFGAARQRGMSRTYTQGQVLTVEDVFQADGNQSLGRIPQQLVSACPPAGGGAQAAAWLSTL